MNTSQLFPKQSSVTIIVWSINTSESPYKLIYHILKFAWNRKTSHYFINFFHHPCISHHRNTSRSTNRAQIKPIQMLTTPQALYLPPCYQFHFCFLKTNNVSTPTSDQIPNPKSLLTIIQPPNIPGDNYQIHWCTNESLSPLSLPNKADFFSRFQEFSRFFNS